MRRIRGVTCIFVILMSMAFLYACGSQKEARLDVITDMALDVVTTMEELTETVSVTEKPIESETTIEETTEQETKRTRDHNRARDYNRTRDYYRGEQKTTNHYRSNCGVGDITG